MRRVAPAPLIQTLVLLILVFTAAPARALETDQFTVPNKPLADLGPRLSPFVMATVWDVAQDANARASWHARQVRRTSSGFWKRYHRGKATQFSSEEYLARRLYEALAGNGLPECKIEQWARRQPASLAGGDGRVPVLFPMTCARAVYGDSIFTKPLLLVDLSPTVNVYGTYMGTDKLGHFFQQGYEYYREYRQEELRGGDERRALARAVRLGVGQESGIFGEALIGVYSNADLAANYAGLKFYLNLTRHVTFGGRSLPPLLAKGEGGVWVLGRDRAGAADAAELLRPFFSDHFNEALNPSRYSDQMRATVRANLRRRAERLVAFYRTTAEQARAMLLEYSTWHGENYGHCRFDRVVTIVDNCFEDDDPPGEARTAAARFSAR